jgi:hypothetical protein
LDSFCADFFRLSHSFAQLQAYTVLSLACRTIANEIGIAIVVLPRLSELTVGARVMK